MEFHLKDNSLRIRTNLSDHHNGNSSNDLSSQSDVSLCTQQKLQLSFWGLPDGVLQFYHSKGITHMFQWQLECLTLGRVLDAGNLVYSAPTSAGKTLVAEILISKTVFELQKKALVILPFVSVVREKMFYFQGMFSSSGINVEGFMGGHSPSINFKQVHLAVCTIEKANSIINRLLEEQSLQNLGLVIVDELHLLSDPYRGYLLELLLTKLKYISSKSEFKIQIVGMSATLPNLKSLANWLNADLYYTDFRPVPLNEKLKCGTTIYDKKLNKQSELVPLSTEASDDSENVGQLCLETIKNGHSVLIFCPTKIWCENLAEKIAVFFQKNGCSKSAETEGTPGWILRKQLDLKKINEVIEHLKMSPVGLDRDLHKTIAFGVAFHHAGLTLDERDIIEGSFRKGSLRVLCATSTLSSGVNLPARRVIIRSPMSFGGLMDILTYRQMIGRAGRMGVDTEGESILICKPNEKAMCQTLMCSNLKPIESCLGHGRLSASLKRAILEIVASGVASSPEEVKKYASYTFLAFSSKHDIKDPIQSCIEFLEENEFIRLQENGTIYVPTPLAKACLASSLPPDEGLALFRELQRARRCFVLDTDLHIIYQVTPYSVSEQLSKVDWLNVLNILETLPASMKRVGELVGIEEAFLVRVVKGTLNPNAPENRNKLSIHRRFYISLALQDLINEIPLSEVAEKYECNKGTLQSLQQSAATYAGMVTEFTKCLGWNSIELIFSQFQERLQFGIQRELCELMRLPLLNAMRARALFNAGYTNLSAIANASATDIENVFFKMAPFQSKKEIPGETTFDKEQRNKLEAVWVTGKADLTISDAAKLLIKESRNILEVELGLEGVKWGKRTLDTTVMNRTQNSIIYSLSSNINLGSRDEISKDYIQEESKSFKNTQEYKILSDTPEIAVETGGTINNCDKILVNKNGQDPFECKINKEELSSKQDMENNTVRIVIDGCEKNQTENEKKQSDTQSVKPLVQGTMEPCLKTSETVSKAQNEKTEIDYFASSFDFDMITNYEIPESDSNQTENKDAYSNDSASDGSIEILYDSNLQITNKNLSLSRLSDDIFDSSNREAEAAKKMSTPIASKVKNLTECDVSHSPLTDTRSPDLFSQSLTFDTQMGKVLDFEEQPAENQLIVNPSSSINSDDLGFVSDLSPAKTNQKKEQKKPIIGNKVELKDACVTNFFLEPGLKTKINGENETKQMETNRNDSTDDSPSTRENTGAKKRKVTTVDSPDLIFDSDEEAKDRHTFKKLKCTALDEVVFLSPEPSIKNDSDEEILPTPKLDKSHLSDISKISRLYSCVKGVNRRGSNRATNPNSRPVLQKNGSLNKINSCSATSFSNASDNFRKETFVSVNSLNPEKINWDKINIIDVCEDEEKFRFYCEQLKEQNILGLALGCRRKIEDKKNKIGMKIIKKRKIDSGKETSFKCHYKDIILDGIAFYWKGNDVYYMSMNDGDPNLQNKINFLKSLSLKEKILRMFDVKEQIKMLHRCTSVFLTSSFQDPKIASWLLAEQWKEKNFSSLVLECIPASKTLVSIIGSVVGFSSPGLLLKSTTSPKTRACLEAFLTYHVINHQLPLLLGKGLQNAFNYSEMPIIVCLAEMEIHGFRICRKTLLNIMEKLDSAKTVLEERAFSLAQHKFNISSATAVSKILMKLLNLERESMALTKKRKLPSTNKEALQELANETGHPLPKIILDWRKIRSVQTKFLSPLLQIATDLDRVFGVSQTFTVTGRISMHEPNLQNIPKNFILNCVNGESISINLREVFVPSEGNLLMSVDYCQIELRMLAHLSKDSRLINDIKDSSDIFINIAATVFGIAPYDVDDSLRQRGKQTCYGMIYGIGPRNLAQQLQIEESDAMELIEDFKNKYEGVKNYLKLIVDECRKSGFVTTLLNRRRYLPAINDSNQSIRMEAERQAINATIQGSAADLVKTAIILWNERVDELLYKSASRLVLHLHDELIFEVNKDEVENVAAVLKDVMENAMELIVPTPVKIKVGSSWGRLESYE